MAGIRDSKTVDGVTYHYDTLNGKVVRQTWTEGTTEHVFDIIYDASGLPYACVYNGSRYYYVLNQQGDVIRIVGYLGATHCEYQYDAWGNVLAITGTYKDTIGKINPIRYRGYYYDTETGFYYLQSRYYDPGTGRFINADSFASTGQSFLGNNMFTYCLNNPVIRIDYGGNRSYFINGIGNYEEDDAPGYAKYFEDELEECGGGEVVLIPVYKGHSVPLLRMGTPTVLAELCIYAAIAVGMAILMAHVVSLISKKSGSIIATIILSSTLLLIPAMAFLLL